MQTKGAQDDQQQLEQAIAALEGQRATLGDAVVDTAVAPLKQKLTDLKANQAVGERGSERRIITVLFCDMVGSTALAENLDPEAWTAIMNQVFRLLTEPVDHYGGTVARLMGDAILALFGAPDSHEDDPERAILAGLKILEKTRAIRQQFQEESGMDINFRVGIHTGLAVVGQVGSQVHTEYTAMGDTVNVASRMEQTASPGTVQISEATYQMVAHLFEVEALGSISVKGRAMPVGTYQVLGRKTRSHRKNAEKQGPLVGRQDELKKLRQAAEKVRHGQGQIALLIGEAGVGKSRLINTIRAEWPNGQTKNQDAVTWTELSATSYSTGRPYGTFENQMRLMAGIAPSDTPAEARQKLRSLLAEDPEHEFLQTVYERLLGIQDEPLMDISSEAFMHALYDSTVKAIRAEVQNQPAVFVFDDWHWMDPASVGLVAHILPLVHELPLFILLAMRPDQGSPAWDLRQRMAEKFGRRFSEIYLGPLAEEESMQLADALLALDAVPPALRKLILDKAEGNPFYIEELVKELQERGLAQISTAREGNEWDGAAMGSIPANLRSLVAARVDRLSKDLRLTLQLASVIGRSFYVRVLEQISDDQSMLDKQLQQLETADMIREQHRAPEREYIFRHALTQEAVYSTLLLEQRRRIHGAVGQAVEDLFPDRLAEFAPVLAHHFDEGQRWEKAADYYAVAGQEAALLHANEQAADFFKRALAIALQEQASAADLIDLFSRLGRVLEHLHRFDQADQTYSELEALGRERGDKSMVLAGLIHHTTLYANPTSLIDFDKAQTLSEQALSLAAEIGDQAAEARLYMQLATMYAFMGNFKRAASYGDRALGQARNLGDRRLLAHVLNDLSSHLYVSMGDFEQAVRVQSEALQLWREFDDQAMETDSLSTLTEINFYQGNFDRSLELAGQALQISRAIHNLWGESYSQFVTGLIHWQRGRPDVAIQTMEESIRKGEMAGFIVPQIFTRADLAHLYASFGDQQRAAEVLSQARKLAGDTALFLNVYCLGKQAAIHLLGDDVGAAEKTIQSVTKPLPKRPPLILFGEMYLARISIDMRRQNWQRALLRNDELLRYMSDLRVKPAQMLVLLQRGRLLHAMNRHQESRDSLLKAREIADSLAAKWTSWQIEAELGKLAPSRDEAQTHFQQAAALVQAILDFTPAHLQDSFRGRPEVQSLFSKLKSF